LEEAAAARIVRGLVLDHVRAVRRLEAA
jgi:hypothetical protein